MHLTSDILSLEGVLERELASSHLGYKARHKRLLRIGQAMSKAASASFPQQFAKNEAGLKGAYRFFANHSAACAGADAPAPPLPWP